VAQSLIEQAWLQPGRTAVSVPVLREFYVNFARKDMLPPRLPRSSVSFVYGRELIILQRFSALVFRCWPLADFPPGTP